MAPRRWTPLCLGTMLLFACGLAIAPDMSKVEAEATTELDEQSDVMSPEMHAAAGESLSIFHTIEIKLRKELSSPHLAAQAFNAVGALLIGILMCTSAEFVFKQIIVLCVFAFCTILTIADMKLRYPDFSHGMRLGLVYGISIEVGLVFAYGTHLGFGGVMLLFGAGLGFFGEHALHEFLEQYVKGSVIEQTLDHLLTRCVVCTIFCLVGIWLVNGSKNQRFKAFFGAFFGGGIISSVVCWAVQTATVVKQKDLAASLAGFEIPAAPYPYIDYLHMLFSPRSLFKPSVGLCVGSKYTKDMHFNADFVGGVFLWLLLGIAGFKYQKRQHLKNMFNAADKQIQGVLSEAQSGWVGSVADSSKAAPLLGGSSRK